jgi:hypothetical protein
MHTSPRGARPNQEDALRQAIVSGANHTGGWGYYAGKTSRVEPTAWALLALGDDASSSAPLTAHTAYLARTQSPKGWLVEDPGWPINIGFNALVGFLWFIRPALGSDLQRRALLGALVATKGIRVETTAPKGQDNSLQGWPWIDATFSWVEPTSWGLLALKAARHAGMTSGEADARIAEAERLLVNRVCRGGGWNFGNASVMNQDLRPYVPTTALALLALQDRPNEPAVVSSLAFLEKHWSDEPSGTSMGLSLICLDAFGRDVTALDERLRAHAGDAVTFGNLQGNAVALTALTQRGGRNAFKL